MKTIKTFLIILTIIMLSMQSCSDSDNEQDNDNGNLKKSLTGTTWTIAEGYYMNSSYYLYTHASFTTLTFSFDNICNIQYIKNDSDTNNIDKITEINYFTYTYEYPEILMTLTQVDSYTISQSRYIYRGVIEGDKITLYKATDNSIVAVYNKK